MPVGARHIKPQKGSVHPREITWSGIFTIGASGAISSQDGEVISGATVTQTASEDGRYDVVFYRPQKRLKFCDASMQGPTDAALPTTTGSDPITRNGSGTGFQVQFKRTDTQADTDPASGTVCRWFAITSEV